LFVFLGNLQAVSPSNPFFDALNDARNQVLRQGSNGGAVKILQLTLNSKGYGLVGDGIFGPATDRAVRQFQANNRLQIDGIVGSQTWNTLLS
jgi:peptidoglycan hydrolase-like protein with peptidoglycan-binding domain